MINNTRNKYVAVALALLTLFVALTAFCTPALATTTITKTVKASGGDYTSINAWEAGEQANLITLDQIRQAECYAMQDTTAVTIDGWTTDATRYIRIYTLASERHDGKWNTNKHRLVVSLGGTAGGAILIKEQYVRIEGLQISVSSSGALYAHGILMWPDTSGSDIRVSNCIVKSGGGSQTYHVGIWSGDIAGNVMRAWNNIVYDFTGSSANSAGFHLTTSTLYAYNNTVQNCYAGYNRGSGTFVAKNNIAYSCTDGFSGTFDGTSDYNLSDLASDAPGANSRNSATVSFIDTANDDFHLASTDTGAKDYGVSDPGSGLFSDDIDGVARTGSWDMGADEYVAASTYYPSRYQQHRRSLIYD